MNEWFQLNQPARVLAEEDAEINWQKQHLQDQERRSRGEEEPRVCAPNMRERDDIVDAGRQEHEKDAEPYHGVDGRKLHEDRHQDGSDNEVGCQQRGEEPYVRKSSAKFREWHLQEGYEQHECQRGVYQKLQRGGLRKEHADEPGQDDRAEVDRYLMAFERAAQTVHPLHAPLFALFVFALPNCLCTSRETRAAPGRPLHCANGTIARSQKSQ